MGNIMSFIISTFVQTVMYSYFTISLTKIFTVNNYSKKQIICITSFIAIIGPIAQLLKKLFPTLIPMLNVTFTILMLFLALILFLKVTIAKSLLISVSTLAFTAITELISVSLTTNILNCNIETIDKNPLYILLLVTFQAIFVIVFIKIFTIIFNKRKSKFTFNITSVSSKQIILFVALLILYIFPQMILIIMNRFEYSNTFLIINSIQFILIFVFLSIYMKKSLEHEKVQMDLYTSELHNKTLVGMVDGVRTLKHDYNNIIQALNGYITTKQYDKMAEHINGVLKECNIINNLSVIDPKIFNEPAIYGVVGAKYFLANKENITFDFDIMTNISQIDFSKPNLSRILGILLDNALEATKQTDNPYIMLEIKYNKRKNADIIRVINTYNTNCEINLDKIYDKGFSTKKVKSGIGLWEVKKLISQENNSQVYATIEKEKFVQNIIIERIK